MNLTEPIASAGGIYKKYAPKLEKLGIFTFKDFLFHVPSRYDDFTITKQISEIQPGEVVSLQGTVLSMKNSYLRSYKTLQKALVTDGTGTLEITWFNQPYLARQIKTNDVISLAGRVEHFGTKLTMQAPEYEIVIPNQSFIHTQGLVPVYHATTGISSKWIRKQVHSLLQQAKGKELESFIIDILPDEIKHQIELMNLNDAFQNIHFPANYEIAKQARDRLAFDELFLLQLQTLHRRKLWRETVHTQALSVSSKQKEIDTLFKSLPFQLTEAQQRAVETILQDVQQTKPMNRMLQGDVGSGKTIVAAIAMYVAILNGRQAVLMAPTEILAEQHYSSIKRLLEPLGIHVSLITGSTKAIKNLQTTNVLVGTHALLYSKAEFSNAGLVVIDEQQRFGVEQRAIIREKGNNPHVLTMTATPIPRTMAMTIYGDLDVSYLNEMPKGRKYIKTWLVPPEKRDSAYVWIEKQIKETDSQAFIICPFIEESENMQTIKAASVEYERLQKDVFPDLKLGLLHGKMKAKEKDQVLLDFKNKKYDILVATPVVEVGIDVPNATIIVIEASERFGLSQLHQLRGRVGRGDKQSYCLLFTETKNMQTIDRLKSMETLHEGSKLAELDLKLRGSGDIYGTQQSGYRMLKIANFSDVQLIEQARTVARKIYPRIKDFPSLQTIIEESEKKKISQD